MPPYIDSNRCAHVHLLWMCSGCRYSNTERSCHQDQVLNVDYTIFIDIRHILPSFSELRRSEDEILDIDDTVGVEIAFELEWFSGRRGRCQFLHLNRPVPTSTCHRATTIHGEGQGGNTTPMSFERLQGFPGFRVPQPEHIVIYLNRIVITPTH